MRTIQIKLFCTNRCIIGLPARFHCFKRNYRSQSQLATPSQDLDHSNYLQFASCEKNSILQKPCLQHWRKNWQQLRRHKLTASTFASAIGFWRRRRTQLWLEKNGAIEPFCGNLATCWNNIKEQDALERYKLITENSVCFPEFQVYRSTSPEDSWLAASPDGVVEPLVYALPSNGVLEIKCPYFNGDMNQAFPWKRIPLNYIPQVQGLMEIMDCDWMFFVWTPKGSSLFMVYRDKEYWQELKGLLSDFWWKHVHPARELYCKYAIKNPLIELKEFRPGPRHELCPHIVYKSKRIVDSTRLLLRETNGRLQYRC